MNQAEGKFKLYPELAIIRDGSNTFNNAYIYNSNKGIALGGSFSIWIAIRLLSYKSVHMAKFKYRKNSEIDTDLLESFLWEYGRAGVVQYGGALKKKRWVMGKVIPKTYDIHHKVKTFKIMTRGEFLKAEKDSTYKPQTLKKTFTNGVDGVVIADGSGFRIGGETHFAPMFVCLYLLRELETVNTLLQNNAIMARSILAVDPNYSQEEVIKINKEIKQLGNVVRLGDREGLFPTDNPMVAFNDFTDRTEKLIMYYQFLENQLRDVMGIDNNPAPDKREREINMEIVMNNVFSGSINDEKLKYRKKGFEQLKALGVIISVELAKPDQEKNNGKRNSERTNQRTNQSD